jgi:hypothetical protein
MPTYTSQKGLILPTVGGDLNAWGGELNAGLTAILDNILGGVTTISVAGNANVTVTSTQAQFLSQKLTGILTGNINLIYPTAGGFYFVNNASTGSFSVTAITSAGSSTGIIVPQGQMTLVWSDGTNVYPATSAFQTLTVLGLLTASGGILGTTTNDNAAAGNVGEYISSTVLNPAAVPLTTGIQTNITSISLTAGDWDVWGNVGLVQPSDTIIGFAYVATNSVSATLPTPPGNGGSTTYTPGSTLAGTALIPAGVARFSLAVTTTIYLVTEVNFTVDTCSAYGFIGARRVR